MLESYSVADAQANLPEILDEVDAGRDVYLTRRGRPVAVVLPEQRYQTLRGQHANFGDAYRDIVRRQAPEEVALEADIFDSLRDRSPER